ANIDVTKANKMLNKIEGIIEHTYAYKNRAIYDYRTNFDCLRHQLSPSVTLASFNNALNKLISNFGDGHFSMMTADRKESYLPFLVYAVDGQFAALDSDRQLIDPQYPYIQAIDGKTLSFWFNIAKSFSVKGSPQFEKMSLIKQLRYLAVLRQEANLPTSDNVQVTLSNHDASQTKTIELSMIDKPIIYSKWPFKETTKRSDNIGYLRIDKMGKDASFVDAAMAEFADTKGLIIDVRGNGGGRRTILNALMPYFLADDEFYISNLARYRMTKYDEPNAEGGYLGNRYLYPVGSDKFSLAEQAQLQQFITQFSPQWTDQTIEWSPWHFMVHKTSDNPKRYHYAKPVVILMDHINFSATDIFLNAFKGRHSVTLIGQASGGGSARSQYYFLDNAAKHESWSLVKMATMASYKSNGQLIEGVGVTPDIAMDYTLQDLIGEQDSMLDKAVSFIATQK
ncbi:MAG: S41 family peptidase, partial [Psychrobium sp.]